MKFLALVLPLVTASEAGPADTVAQKNAWAEYERSLDEKIAAVNGKCGAKLDGNYDPSTYPEFDPLQDRTQSACQQAVDAIGTVCATPAGKQAIQALRTVTCRFSTTGTGVQVRAGGLVVSIDPKNTTIAGDQPGGYTWKSAIEERL